MSDLPLPREVTLEQLQAAADAWAATPAAQAENTYLCRIRDMAAALREQGSISSSDKLPDPVTRARAAHWIVRAWRSIPRPHMAARHGKDWLPHLVTRSMSLEGEIFRRIVGIKLDADVLPEEGRSLSRARSRSRRAHVPEHIRIALDWTGEPSVAGDYCIEALLEVLDDGRDDLHAGQADPGSEALGLLGGEEGHPLPLADDGPAGGDLGCSPSGVLAS